MLQKLYVGNLAANTTKDQLHNLFSQAGKVLAIDMVSNRYSGNPRGFSFVIMVTEAGAFEAIKRFHGHLLNDRVLTVGAARAEGAAGDSDKSRFQRNNRDF
jgi:cold-inducible RNA-binding protein